MVAEQQQVQIEPELIAGRYRVERPLATGGMGEVLAVVDQSTGRRLALKRLLELRDDRLAGMFEREYHTLAGLKHPRIIEVYDYSVDHGRPYYTMELLDGEDLRGLSPLPYRRACRYLRDVASSLALLHARRLLHRDLSPRNVRVTSDDRCKLIDFGALSSFGIAEVVVGTPPFVAPEAVRRTPLDQRADLFALGALAYWLLTGRQAFPAHSIHELPGLWRSPPPAPSLVLAETASADAEPIPKAMDELVMALLTPDPLGRPASAGEVIDRLNDIAELAPEHEAFSARSYLHGAPTVGRAREQARLRKRLNQVLTGSGAAVVLDAAAGMGSTRLLSELVLDAQLAGVTPVMVDAELHRGVYGVVHALIAELVVVLPQECVAALGRHAATLARFSPAFPAPDRHSEIGHLPPGELRGRTQQALLEWLFVLARRRPLLLAVDNAHRVDEASAAFLASVARSAREHALLLAVTRKPHHSASSPAAMRGIEEAGASLQLRGLSNEDVHALVRGVFGGAQHTARLAKWLHQLSGGNPQACMELVHHLVDTDVLRFKEGVWVLPQELSPSELPASLDHALDIRLQRLRADAQRLAEALCVHRGSLPIERCLGVAVAEGVTEPHAALDELTREAVIVQSGSAYHFAHETLRERLYSRLSPERRQALHRHFGRFLSQRAQLDVNSRLDAGWHLLNGGSDTEGADLLADAGASLVDSSDELAAAIPALCAALAVFRRERRGKHALIRLLAPLALAGYAVDRRLALEYGDEAVAVFQDLIGLTLAIRLRPLLGRHLSLYLGLASGAVRALFHYGFKVASEFEQLIASFFTCATSLAGSATICLDAARAKRYAQALEPLSALGANHPAAIAYDFSLTLSRLPEDQMAEVSAGCSRLLERFDPARPPIKGIPAESALLLRGGAYYALGAMSCFRDGDMALRCASELDGLGLKLYAMAADQIRASYHSLRGELGKAEPYRQRVETHAIQAGSGWQVEIWSPSAKILVYTLTRDVIGIKGVAEELDRLHQEVPTLTLHHELARGVYYELKGNQQVSHEIRRAVLEAVKARSFIGWPPAMGDEAATLIALGRAEEGKKLAQSVLDGMTAADEPFIAMYQRVHTSLALADASLGDFEAATRRLDALIEKHRSGGGPVTLGNLHAMRVRVALMMKDMPAAEQHLASTERWFRPTENPALIAQCEKLRRELSRVAAAADPGRGLGAERSVTQQDDEIGTLRSVLSQCAGPKQRAERALELLIAHARGKSGFLYLYQRDQDRLSLVAPLHGDDSPAELEMAVLDAIHVAADASEEVTAVVSESMIGDAAARSRVDVDGLTFRIFPLATKHHGRDCVLGAVAVAEGESPLMSPRIQVLEALARALFEAGDEERITVRPPRPALGRN